MVYTQVLAELVMYLPCVVFTVFNLLTYHLNTGASIDAKDARGKTALFYALDEGSEKTAIYLMKNKCDVNVMDNGGHSALYEAIHSQFFHSTECLLLLESSGEHYYT